ncbi:AMP-binding protein, partial [Porphyromonas gingivalis]|uniref:AMP-binding protein n=1 Tax=Porphyromonas gingivalis TaxID=837 RepID=UPI001180D3DC
MIKLNSFQKTFYFEWLQDNSKADYNLVIDMDLHGEISPERLNRAITRFVNEHLLYNSNVRYINGDYYWISRSCLNEKENILKYIDFLPSKKELFSFVKEPFDLESDRLSRYYLVRISESHYRFINVVSHIIVDGLSAESVYKNLACYYNDAEFRSEYSLEEQAEMIIKLNAKLSLIQENYKASMNNFWQRQLCNSTGIDLKFLKNQSQQSKLEIHSRKLNPISEFFFSIVDEEWNLVKEISRKYKITPFILSQVAFAFVIQKYTGQDCISFNFPVAIQEGRDLIYGAHVNSIIITFYFSDQTTLLDLIEQATSFYKDLKSSKGKYLPIYELVKYAENKSALNAGFIQTDLAEYILDFDGVKSVSANREFHIDLDQDFVFESQIVKSSLNQNEQLKFRVRYKNGIINHELAELFVKSYKEALLVISKQLMASPSQTINDINKESVLDYNKTILSVINEQSKSVYDATKTVIMRFEEQVKRRPNDIAIVFDNKEISYTQLNIEANKLANYLKRAYNIKPDDFVCLCLERSEWMVIAMLGVLKCGAAYVPISPDYPLERVQYIINDVSPIVTIISQASASKLSLNNDVLSILIEQDYLWKNESDNNLELNIDSKNLAYVIYTSGTTGKAKGVMIEHRGLVNLCLSLNEKLRIYFHKKNINYLWYSNYVFDAHVMDLYPYLIHGHRVFIANEDVRLDVEGLKEYISSNKIDLSLIPPSFLNKNQIFNIKNLIVGGDITNSEIITQYLKAGTNIINAYGPTEVTVCATTHPYSIGDKNTNIGRPIANTTTYVLDKYLNPLPVGAIGELYIGGDGV